MWYSIVEYNMATGHRQVVGTSEYPEDVELFASRDSETDHTYYAESTAGEGE